MNKRRFKITYEEGEIIILALDALTDELNQKDFGDSVFWKHVKIEAQHMSEKLKNYEWWRD